MMRTAIHEAFWVMTRVAMNMIFFTHPKLLDAIRETQLNLVGAQNLFASFETRMLFVASFEP